MADTIIGLKIKLDGSDARKSIGEIRKDIEQATISLDATKLKFGEFSQEAVEAANRLEALKKAAQEAGKPISDIKVEIKQATAALEQTKLEFGEFSEEAINASKYLDKLKRIAEDTTKPVSSIRTEIKQATAALIEAQQQFGEYSAEAVNAAKKVAELKDRVQDAAETAALFDPGKKFQAFAGALNAVAGGFSAVQGALGLIGVESEEVEKQLLKVQSALALSQGLSTITDSVKDFQRLKAVLLDIAIVQKANAAANALAAASMRLLGISVNTTSLSFRVLKTAIAATGIGLLVVGIASAVEAFNSFQSAATRAANAQKDFAEQGKKLADVGIKAELEQIDRQTKLLSSQVKARGGTAQEIEIIERNSLELRKKSYQRYFDDVVAIDREAARDAQINIDNLNNELRVADNIIKANELERQKEQNQKIADKNKEKAEQTKEQEKQAAIDIRDLKREAQLNLIKDEEERSIKQREFELKDQIQSVNNLKINEKLKEELRVQLRLKADADIQKINQERSDREVQAEKEYQQKVANVRSEILLNSIVDEDLKSIEAIRQKYANQFAEITIQEEESGIKQTELRKALIERQAQEIGEVEDAVAEENANKQIEYNQKQIENEQLTFDARRMLIEESLTDLDYFYSQGIIKEDEYNKQKEALTDARIQLTDKEKQAQYSMLQAYSDVAGAISQLVGQNTALGKSLAIAQATIDTYTSTSAMFLQASKNPITIANPAYPYIVAASSVISGIARVKAIASVKVPYSGGGGQGSGTAPQLGVGGQGASQGAPIRPSLPLTQTVTQLQSGTINQMQNASIRAYVVESDITTGQERIKRLNRAARLG